MPNIKIAIIGGSGLDDPKILKNAVERNIETIYGATSSTFLTGKIMGVDVVVLARHGRGHVIPPTQVPFRANIWALKEIGCTHILATTACGSLQAEIRPGDFVFLDQFIDFTKQRNMTFFESFKDKIAHTPMAEPFCPQLRGWLIEAARELNIPHHQAGTTITIEGPRFSTRAESRYFKSLGADVINMSTLPEVILARELGICYASVAMATDYDAWKISEAAVTWEMISNVMKDNAANVIKLLLKVIPKIDFDSCEHCSDK